MPLVVDSSIETTVWTSEHAPVTLECDLMSVIPEKVISSGDGGSRRRRSRAAGWRLCARSADGDRAQRLGSGSLRRRTAQAARAAGRVWPSQCCWRSLHGLQTRLGPGCFSAAPRAKVRSRPSRFCNRRRPFDVHRRRDAPPRFHHQRDPAGSVNRRNHRSFQWARRYCSRSAAGCFARNVC